MSVSRIYTEDVNRECIIGILDAALNGYTIIPAIGRYNGVSENSLVIEIFDLDHRSLIALASRIGEANSQESVAVMYPSGMVSFIYTLQPAEVAA